MTCKWETNELIQKTRVPRDARESRVGKKIERAWVLDFALIACERELAALSWEAPSPKSKCPSPINPYINNHAFPPPPPPHFPATRIFNRLTHSSTPLHHQQPPPSFNSVTRWVTISNPSFLFFSFFNPMCQIYNTDTHVYIYICMYVCICILCIHVLGLDLDLKV